MDRDRRLRRIAFREIITLKHTRDGLLASKLNHIGGGHVVKPFGVKDHVGFFFI